MTTQTTKFPTELLKKCRFLAGPTASGKTDVALALAEILPIEIVLLDSMTVYRKMDIGTAKPSESEMERVPHHLVNLIEPHEEYSLSQYVATARKACEQIVARNNIPLFVGGTGLYLRGILRGVFEGPAADWDFRNEMEQATVEKGTTWLHQQLKEVDERSAARLHPNDQRRVIRALEVHRLTGKKLSDWQQENPTAIKDRPKRIDWLNPPRDWLYKRIDRRVLKMIDLGLKEEVKQLLQQKEGLGRTARQGLGYKEMIAHLEGNCSQEETIEEIQLRSRQFAKRQYTWFRNLEECTPVEFKGTETAAEIAKQIL